MQEDVQSTLRDLRTQRFNGQRDLAKARYDVLVNSLKLRQAAGRDADAAVVHVDHELVAGRRPVHPAGIDHTCRINILRAA